MAKIVRPQHVDIREAWPREDRDLTPWLADNLDYLDDLGLGELDAVDTEVTIPGARRQLDILAVTSNGRRVAIENQYRSADHDHLTRGLAYAVALDSVALVVIAESHRDEFTAVANYLNSASEALGSGGISVFLVSLHVERVGDFLVPRFEVVSRPNSWLAEVRKNPSVRATSEAASVIVGARRMFWAETLDAAATRGLAQWANSSPRVTGHISSTAYSGFDITWNMVVHAHSAHPMLWIDVGDPEKNEQVLWALRDAVLAEGLGFGLEWDPKQSTRSCSVRSEPIENCGWKVSTPDRAEPITELVERTKAFIELIDPVLAIVVDEVRGR